MKCLKINGGKKLSGSISVHGAKNSVLPILSACVLINGVPLYIIAQNFLMSM